MTFNYNFKTLIISTIIIFTLCINSQTAFGQLFGSEQNPPSIKFLQINTSHFQIIYPAGLEVDAQRMANTLEEIISKVSSSLSKEPRKISIILQNQGTESNGFVQMAPRRSEFFTPPPQSFDYQDWLNSLAVHELRHVVQFEKLTSRFKAPLFEELALAIFGITLPPWFYEGDAVGIETALTNAGRGRLPEWELVLRTNTLSGKDYSYSKNYFGSVKDRSPGYYQLGYFMTSKLRRDYGKGSIDSILTRIKRNPFRPYSLSNSLKKLSGMNSKNFHDSTVSELRQLWQNQSQKTRHQKYDVLNIRKDQTPADYYFPQIFGPGKILVLKQGLAIAPVIVQIDADGKEKNILKIGYQEQPNFNYAAGKIVWDEFRYDKRFQKRSFSVINIYDIASKKFKQLSHKSRLFSPSLSSDGKSIVAVKLSLDNKMNIVELNAETGEEIKQYPNDLNYNLQFPSYSADNSRIVFTAVNKSGITLAEIRKENGKITELLPPQSQLISNPKYAENQILFRAHYNGIDNIYRFDRQSRIIFQLTFSEYGAYNPSYDSASDQILFNNYQVSGHDVASIKFGNEQGVAASELSNHFINYAQPLAKQENYGNVFDSIPSLTYTSKPYKELTNLFYFHSLALITDASDPDDPTIGLKIKSNNKLNTLDFYAGYQFNNELNKSEFLTGFTYKRFYPVLDVRYINQARLSYSRQQINNQVVFIPVNWREHLTEIEISVPFLFNQLNQTYSFGLNTSSSYTSRYSIENRPGDFRSILKFPMKYQLYLNRNSRRSARDLAPEWGQNFSFTYQHFPFENIDGDIFSFRSLFYAPGFFQNHSVQARLNYQINSGAYDLTVDIPRVSGYNNLTPTRNLESTLLLNYRFPLFYPDWEIGTLAYIKRFRGGLFSDFENVGRGRTFAPRTYGAELQADMNLLRFYLPNFALGGKFILVNEKPAKNPIFEMSFTYSY
ncbi:TolB family protein [Daejeonella oryzae]|uniref:TolB family protein n=1 Tax=Daejeonella oryzae TaxID=1122943 RepID=UPI00040DE1BF|nr:hypothetical protein [Daejeonella oryzae]